MRESKLGNEETSMDLGKKPLGSPPSNGIVPWPAVWPWPVPLPSLSSVSLIYNWSFELTVLADPLQVTIASVPLGDYQAPALASGLPNSPLSHSGLEVTAMATLAFGKSEKHSL